MTYRWPVRAAGVGPAGHNRRQPRCGGRTGLAVCLCILSWLALVGPAAALKPITLTGNQDWLEVTALGEAYEGRGDTLQIETAPAADGATARIAVRATQAGTNPNWIVFALNNPTNKAIELWLTADRYNPIGSGIVWPDLDTRRIAAVTHSAGFAPERIKNDRVDVFRLTVERGQTITYVAELASDRFSRIMLWKPIEFEQRQRERQLFNGIMLGITGLLAVFLTAVFAANHKAIFPTAALVAWCALGLLCVDFGFWHKLFQMKPEDNAQYRAAAEAALAASLVIFLSAFLRVSLWHGFARTLFVVWIVAQLAIVGIAILDPRLAATVARLSLGLIGVLGLLLILLLSVRGLDRALALMPTWILFLVWLFGAAVTLTGRLSGEFAISGIVSGLVLILVLIGFTVTQFAFRSAEPLLGTGPGGQQLRLAAMDRAGVAFWEWSVRRDELRLDPEIEAALGLAPGELPTRVDQLIAYLHPADRERFRHELAAIRERGGGMLRTGIRVRHADSSYRWLDFEGASVPTSDRRNLRCVGLVRDATDAKRAQERLLHNAVYDSLTSLPNRELLVDRLAAVMRAATVGEPSQQVTVFMLDVDKFRSVNASFGLVVGDSIILTVSRRLARIVGTSGTLARIGGDQFAVFLVGDNNPRDLAAFAERLRLSLRSPIRIAGQEIVLTGSIGIAIHDGTAETPRDLLRDAEVAMHRAKRLGSDRAEIFSPELISERQERAELERDLARALDQRQITVLYQPLVSLANDELVGFEAVVRWQHPRLGALSPADFMPLAEGSDLVTRLGSLVIGRAVTDLARWQQELARPDRPLFVAVSVSSRQLISTDLIQEVRHARARAVLPAGTLKLAFAEALVMENPEQASHVLDLLRDAGVDLWLDRFGTGYSSLAYLARFPFETFRLDRALVEWSGQGERDAALVRSMVAVAHELGRKVAGDGVESGEDAAFLRSVGCHFAQGFHYGEAMGEDEVVRLLRLIRKSERRMRRRGMVRAQDKKKSSETSTTSIVPDAPGLASPQSQVSMPIPGGQKPAPPTAPASSNGRGTGPQGPAAAPPAAGSAQRPVPPVVAATGSAPPAAPAGAAPPRPDTVVNTQPRSVPIGFETRPQSQEWTSPTAPVGPRPQAAPSGTNGANPPGPARRPPAPAPPSQRPSSGPIASGPMPGAAAPTPSPAAVPPGRTAEPQRPQTREAPAGPVTTSLESGRAPPPSPVKPAQTTAPAASAPSTAEPHRAAESAARTGPTTRPGPASGSDGRRPSLATLSPSVAASLARLAGRADAASAAGTDGESSVDAGRKKPDAAE
ncbi:MAG: EAL domain-containing protein [Hyphomicrobiaceae bacterium]|nr:EAL domain-containing protein [Hyphomicrobiaceae bacterium]